MGDVTAFRRIALTAVLLALCVVVLGAWVRLSDAGLGCPDWPVCYGQITWPQEQDEVVAANQAFPERPVEHDKTWREQIHRHLAAILGLLVLALALMATWQTPGRRRFIIASAMIAAAGVFTYIGGKAMDIPWLVMLAGALAVPAVALPLLAAIAWRRQFYAAMTAGLLGLIIFQALLGMWTVTLLLKPVFVMGHLLGGMSTLALLWWLYLRSRPARLGMPPEARFRTLALVALLVLACQIALGGWTSSNYAALACPDFPTCQGQMWPDADFAEGFVLWRELGVDYEGGVLHQSARVAIHLAHRIGAVVTFFILGFIVIALMRVPFQTGLRAAAAITGLLLLTQLGLGVGIVLTHLPLAGATAHNAAAALLLLSVVTLNHLVRPKAQSVQ